jgi:antitoxin (DNA-binding transcriptional repressor) of toxin-antitoxin stability system
VKIILYSPFPCKGRRACGILEGMNININSAKSYFTEMIDEVVKGNEYFILRQGKPIVQIIPVKEDALSRAEIVERLFSYQTLK